MHLFLSPSAQGGHLCGIAAGYGEMGGLGTHSVQGTSITVYCNAKITAQNEKLMTESANVSWVLLDSRENLGTQHCVLRVYR